jgi:hypothetical protein
MESSERRPSSSSRGSRAPHPRRPSGQPRNCASLRRFRLRSATLHPVKEPFKKAVDRAVPPSPPSRGQRDGSRPHRMVFQTPRASRAAPVWVVVLLVSVVFLTAAMVDGLRFAFDPYTLLALSVLALLLVLHAVRSPWRLLLEPHGAWLGSARHGQRIPYEGIRFLVAADASSQAAPDVARLSIETDRRKYVIQLRSQDAEEAIRELRALCPHASGVPLSGPAFVPAHPADAALGARRVRRVWLRRAAGWASLSVLIAGSLVFCWRRLPQDRAVALCSLLVFPLWKAATALRRASEHVGVSAPRSPRQ